MDMQTERLREDIAAAQAGAAQGFESLLATFGPRLYGFFLKATGNHHDAEDLLGEISVRLVRSIADYDDRGRFEPWLFRIAANMVRDSRRHNRCRPGAISLSGQEEDGEPFTPPAPPQGDRLEASEDADRLAAALESLDENTRRMIMLRHYGQMSFKEIAALFAMPLGTVLARVHRGLGTLRRLLATSDES